MAYIIENANISKGNEVVKSSILVENDRFAAMKGSFQRYNLVRMDLGAYIMTPAFVYYEANISAHLSAAERKSHYINRFILNGCTTFITAFDVNYEAQFETNLKRMKTNLLNSPIDYIIGVRIAAGQLTPSLIQKCKRAKIPAIFLEVSAMKELELLPWGWIRESMFPYNSPLIPIFPELPKGEKERLQKQWHALMYKEKIPAIYSELDQYKPLKLADLAKIGAYPLKANLQQGSEISYNLFRKSREISSYAEIKQYESLAVTVHKGDVIRAGSEVIYRPGFGEHVIIHTPSYYKIAD